MKKPRFREAARRSASTALPHYDENYDRFLEVGQYAEMQSINNSEAIAPLARAPLAIYSETMSDNGLIEALFQFFGYVRTDWDTPRRKPTKRIRLPRWAYRLPLRLYAWIAMITSVIAVHFLFKFLFP